MSNFVKTLTFPSTISATVSAGVAYCYLSRFTNLFRQDRLTHIHILSEPSFGITTMGVHHSVGMVTEALIPCSYSSSNSAFGLSL